MDRGLMPQNLARDLRLNRATTNTTKDAWTTLDPGEQEQFLAAMPADERRYYAFAIGAGLRPGEQRGLLKADVYADEADPYLIVRYGSPKKPTKTGKPRRVPLFGLALEAVREQLVALKGVKNPRGVFWPGERGRYRDERVPEQWGEWLKAAGIDREVRRYDLRHTCASALVSGWWGRRWTLEEVKDVLGHTDIKTTQRYAHLGATAIRDAVRETQLALTGPKLVQNGANRAQAHEIAGSVLAFVNRRPRVQVSKSDPQKTCVSSDLRQRQLPLVAGNIAPLSTCAPLAATPRRERGGSLVLTRDAALLTDAWTRIQSKALTPLEDVQAASRIGLRLTRLAGGVRMQRSICEAPLSKA